jgi:hypothetical protein
MRWLDFEFDFNVIAWNLLCSTQKLRWVLSKPTLVIKCHSLVVCFITIMSDDSCIWCHAPVKPCQEAAECDICSRWHHRRCGNMGYAQYNYDAGTSLQWYKFIVIRVYIGTSWLPVVWVDFGTSLQWYELTIKPCCWSLVFSEYFGFLHQ